MRLFLACLALPLLLMMAGCAPYNGGSSNHLSPSEDGSDLEVRRLEIEDKTVTCIIFMARRMGGVSCDFANELYRRG